MKHFKTISTDFKAAFTELQTLLKKDESLRYLTFRLDFNEYYSKKKTTGILDLEELKKHGIDYNMF